MNDKFLIIEENCLNEEDIHKSIENVISNEFPKFINIKKEIRKKLIRENIKLKLELNKKLHKPNNKILIKIENSPSESIGEFDFQNHDKSLKHHDEEFKTYINNYKFKIEDENSVENKSVKKKQEKYSNKKKFFYLNELFKNDIEIPKGNFYYPLEEVVRVEEKSILDFMPLFKNFSEFDKMMQVIKTYMEDWFEEYPKNRDITEKISNPEFLAWVFFKSIKQILFNLVNDIAYKSMKFSHNFFSKFMQLQVDNFSRLINKKNVLIVRIIKNFIDMIMTKIDNKEQQNLLDFELVFDLTKTDNNNHDLRNYFTSIHKRVNNFSNLHTYRKSYCNICFVYFCPFHFEVKYDYKIFNGYNTSSRIFEKEFSSFNLRKLNRLENASLNYLFKNKKNFDCKISQSLIKFYEDNSFICSISNCKMKRFTNSDDELDEDKIFTIIKNFDKRDLYLLVCFSDFINTSCFMNKYLFEYKYSCDEIDHLILVTIKKRTGKNYVFFEHIINSIENHFNLPTNFIIRDEMILIDHKSNLLSEKIETSNNDKKIQITENLNFDKDMKNLCEINIYNTFNRKAKKNFQNSDNYKNILFPIQDLKSIRIKTSKKTTSYISERYTDNLFPELELNEGRNLINKSEEDKFSNLNPQIQKDKINGKKVRENFASKRTNLSINFYEKQYISNYIDLNDNSTKSVVINKLDKKSTKKLINSLKNSNSENSNISLSGGDHNRHSDFKYIPDYNSYAPCNHIGKCTLQTCDCLKNRGVCEKFCFCYPDCKHIFTGCECKRKCETSCKCKLLMRDCDPDICHYSKEEFQKKKKTNFLNDNSSEEKNKWICCENMKCTLDIKKKTKLSKSIITEGYGLFADEGIKKDDYICEYRGELISKEESDKRSVFNDYLGLNYFFKLNESFDIDALLQGNEMRYVNHSSFGYDNCYAKSRFCRGKYKIALFASREIKRGEELFFDYKIINVNIPWLIKYKKTYKNLSN